MDPGFVDENSGTSGDDHPHADVRTGQTLLNQLYSAVVQSPAWQSTALVINYDEWGGFFDHVPPPTAPIPPPPARRAHPAVRPWMANWERSATWRRSPAGPCIRPRLPEPITAILRPPPVASWLTRVAMSDTSLSVQILSCHPLESRLTALH